MDLAPDSDPVETREWRDALDSVLAFEGPERAHFLLGELMRRGAPQGRAGALLGEHALPQHHPARPRGRRIRATGRSSTRSAATSAGTRWRSSCAPTRRARELGGHIASFQSSALLYDTGFMHFWHAPTESHGGDLVYVQGHCSPGHLRAQLHRGPPERGAAAQVPPGGRRRRAELLPASLADAGLLAVPDRLDGPRPVDGDLPGPLPQVPARPRPRRDRQPQGLGVPGRRRVRRAREPGCDLAGRARASRQSGVRHQLQPAAPRRAGARQRQDHPGAGGDLPRCRLERGQGPVGLGLGQADRRRHQRHPAQADGGGGRRRVPGLQVEERRLCPRALLRQVSRARGHGRRTGPTTRSGPWSAAATTRSRSTPPTTRPRTTRASPPSSWPRPSRATAWARRARGRTSPISRRRWARRTCTSSPPASACR